MEYKMRKQENAEAMGRGRDTLTRRNFSKRRRRGGFAKKAMAYFLSFLMLAGNLQSVSYAEEIAGETVERIALATEEKSSESLREREEEKEAVLSSEEKREERKTSLEETALEKEESDSEGKKEKKENLTSEEVNKTAPSEAKTEESSLEEKTSLSSEEAKQEEKPEYMDAGSFEASYGKDITVLASFSEGTFFEGTKMKVVPVDSESILEEAKALSLKDYKKKNPGEVAKVEVLEAIDISFYREVNGVEKEVQPKNGKKVELRLQKSKKIKDALAKTEENFKEDQEEDLDEELQIVHLSEDHPGEILSVKEEGEELLFSAKHFSPNILIRRTRDLGEEAVNHDFKAFWTEAPNAPRFGSIIPNGHTYTNNTNGDMREQRDLQIIPPENASNGTDTTTLGIELTEQRVHGAAGDHAVQVADAAVENHADYAESRNREGEIEEWPGDGTKTIGPSISEDAVCHEGTDYREDRGKCRIEGDNLRCLHLREADSLGSCRIEVIDEDGRHTVAGNLPHHKLEVHDADAKGMADETGFVLQLLDLFLPLSLLFIEYCCCNCFHKQEPPIAMKKLLQPVKKQTSFPIRFSSAKPPL